MSKKLKIEHNLFDYEFEEVLQKALGASQKAHEKPLDDPFLNEQARKAKQVFEDQMKMAMDRIAQVIGA